MKRFGFFLVPIITLLLLTQLIPRLFAGGMSPRSMILAGALIIGILLFVRPKKAETKSADAVASEILDGYCADAFASDEALRKNFYSALHDIGGNMPKAAVNKLEKLADRCTGKQEQYAVAMATAMAFRKQNNLRNAIREYNKALVINPTGPLAFTIGDAHQRNGDLDKARDSYEFAMELEPENAKYPSAFATALVGDGRFKEALDYAQDALELDNAFPQALATMAICHGILGDTVSHSHYLKKAMENGYKEEKITETIKALKKRFPNA